MMRKDGKRRRKKTWKRCLGKMEKNTDEKMSRKYGMEKMLRLLAQ